MRTAVRARHDARAANRVEGDLGGRGTRGGLSAIDHATRLMPRRLLAGSVSTTLPLGVQDLELELAEEMACAGSR